MDVLSASLNKTFPDGWKIDDKGMYEVIWFNGPQLPPSIIITEGDKTENDETSQIMKCVLMMRTTCYHQMKNLILNLRTNVLITL